MGIIASKEDLKGYVEEKGYLPLYKNEIMGFSVEEMALPGSFRSGNRDLDPRCWRRELSRDCQMAFGMFFDGREGFVSKEQFPCFAAYRSKTMELDRLEEQAWEILQDEILGKGSVSRRACKELLGQMESPTGSERLLKHLQAGACLIQQYQKKEIHYILPEQRWGKDYVWSGSFSRETAWDNISQCIKKEYPDLTQRQLLTVFGCGKDRRAVVRQRDSYPDNFLKRLLEPASDSFPGTPDRIHGRQKGLRETCLKDIPGKAAREALAEELLAEVRGRERDLILLRYKEQMTISGICQLTGLSDEYVRKRIRNGIRRIQRKSLSD